MTNNNNNHERWFSTYEHFQFVIKTSIKLLGFYLFIYYFFYDNLIKLFLTSFLFVCFFSSFFVFFCFLFFVFLRKLFCICYHKFQSMLRLVTVCRPAKAFIFLLRASRRFYCHDNNNNNNNNNNKPKPFIDNKANNKILFTINFT